MSMDIPTRRLLPMKVHPRYLGTNAQIHPWPFSAIAELIDNAYDPDASADSLHIQVQNKHGKPCLIFTDDGYGMDFDHLYDMLSLGYNEKDKYRDVHAPIGEYGNGFKSGSMRLAKDALVFTVHKESEKACIGLLSQSLCMDRNIKSCEFALVEYSRTKLTKLSREGLDMDGALEEILDVSPYSSEGELKAELEALKKQKKRGGTKIVLFNLLRTNTREFELDFESDPEDIRNPHDQQIQLAHGQQSKDTSYRQSLRRYCSILYLKSRMEIIIKGKPVEKFYFLGDLKEKKDMTYRPRGKDKQVAITFGIEKKTGSGMLEDDGVLLYNDNRLIKPYVKLACQSKGIGHGVVGVVDVTDVLKPIQNKQDFMVNTTEYTTLIKALSKKMMQYCECGDSSSVDDSEEEEKPGPSSKGKHKSTEPGEHTAVKRPRNTSATTHSPAGHTDPTQTAPGKTPDGKTAPGKTAPGKTPDGKTAPGKTPDGKTAPGKTASGKTASGKTAPGKTADDKTAPGKTADDKTASGKTGTRKHGSSRVLQTTESVQSSSRNQLSLNAVTTQQSDGAAPTGDAQREHLMRFRQNVHVLLTDMEGPEKIGDVDHVEESLREVLKSRGLPFK